MTAPNPFRFLDLPKEIRLIVYERLPRQIKHHHVINPFQSEDRFVLITRCLPVAILSTCKFINSEATNIVRKIQNEFILSQCPQFIANRQLFFQTGFMSALPKVQGKETCWLIAYAAVSKRLPEAASMKRWSKPPPQGSTLSLVAR
ncbi:uncharacterized protein J4E79_009730 [Alternaria viburni]|uniref:uncharacterized protein n=1 Tax=Alternaria viburni TaxID=566460 RepID=UPI0020C2E201|nr:uncharacterized protein J4E79_009730 [Alternaria viburni]KAI4649884.1 hypothetical protein J4E79_009730 [Alternaria viburni]